MPDELLTSVRDALFRGGQVARENVTMPDGVSVDVIGLPLTTRGKILLDCMTTSGKIDDNGKAEETLDMGKLGPFLAVECTFLPGTQTKVFSPADIESVGLLDARYMDYIVKKAMELSGLSKKALDDAKGNLSATPVSGSPSVSLVN